MKNKKLIILIASLILLCTTVSGFVYYRNRKEIYKNIESDLNSIRIDYYSFFDYKTAEAIDLLNSNKFKTNSKLKEIEKTIYNFITSIETSQSERINSPAIVGTINIETLDNVGMSLTKDDGYVDTKITFTKTNGEIIEDDEAKIKIRGNSTSGAQKKPYNIKFSEKVDLLDCGKAKKWSLLADCYDVTLMRNYTFTNLARTMNLEYTSFSEYVELTIDGIYRGCYLLIEPVESGSYRIDVDIDNGDFMIEYEKEAEEEGNVYLYVGDDKLRFVLNEPEEPTSEQLDRIQNIMDEIVNTLKNRTGSDIDDVIDVTSFAKYYIVNEFAKTVDFDASSVKFYYKNGKLYAGPVWDFDMSSGNLNTDAKRQGYFSEINGEIISYEGIYCNQQLYKYLLNNEYFINIIKECFKEYSNVLQDVYKDGGFIDTIYEKYKTIYERNYNAYTNGGANWNLLVEYSYNEGKRLDTYEKNVLVFKNWLQKRYKFLESVYID